MIEISFKYSNKLKFEKYTHDLLVKHGVSLSETEIDYKNCRLIIHTEEEGVKELIKDRLVLMVKESKRKK